ncbi:MAG: UDP-glucose 4-epimerase family protein [Burkholderiaceae bacterium]
MPSILVTGANGFVGTALCQELSERHISFIGAVRKKTAQHQIQVGDLNSQTDWRQALAGRDVVIHLAARVHVMNEQSNDPAAAFKVVNVDASLNLAKQAVKSGVKRFVYVSSVKVNGEETTGLPYTAFDEPKPLDPYGQSKLDAEIALRELSRETGLEVVVVRPPLVYGPGVSANFLKLMQLVKWRVPLPLGAVANSRSMVSVQNLVDLLIVCSDHPAASGQTFLVSDDHDVSVTELLRMLATAMGRRSYLLPIPTKIISGTAALLGKSAVSNRLLGSLQVDITHTKSTLSWKPVISMHAALDKTVAHFLTLQ